MRSLFSTSMVVLLFSFLIAGCSGSGSDDQTNARTIDVIGIDKLKFVVAEQHEDLQTGEEVTVNGTTYYVLEGITAQAGEELTINLENISTLPATAMAHNWLLLEMNTDVQAFNNAAMSAKDNDYVSPEMEDQVIADTGLLGGGESSSVTFTVPDQTGEYDYLCTFPAHYSAGMQGTLTVE